MADWSGDFAAQPLARRPRLEVRYADATRQAALIEAAAYDVHLQLAGDQPVGARLSVGGMELARLDLVAEVDGRRYSSRHAASATRINLYRRGPYYCDVRWFDLSLRADDGTALPIRGEVILHAYPDKLHLEAVLHVTEPLTAGWCRIDLDGAPATLSTRAFEPARWGDLTGGDELRTALALAPAGSPAALTPAATITLLGGLEARYDPRRGSYLVWTDNMDGGFNYHYYVNRNHYETARVRFDNPGPATKVYLCHATRRAPGGVECGVILDDAGDPLPLTVQISKNFAGEREEPFYNPTDIPFSETFVPLYLGAGESRELTSLHLYQNWGNWPLKQFSSLGAWMDYFHSSTGVTETTCFVPFKFGGLGGISIADFRAMSQSMWDSQPQHDNVAGHRFLVYRSGGEQRHAEYLGTTYRSTGPNWMDIRLDYLSQDGALRASLDSFEISQLDELRNFLRLRVEVLAPVAIDHLGTDFHLVDALSNVQALRHTHVAHGAADRPPTVVEFPAADGQPLAGVPLDGPAPWAAIFGTRYQPGEGHQRGANAIVVRRFDVTIGGIAHQPAVTLTTRADGNTALALTIAGGAATLQPGDVIDVEFYLMPYGDDSADETTPAADAPAFAAPGPRITAVARGTKLSDFPARLRADGEACEFSLAGPNTVLPVLIEGLSDFRGPRLEYRQGEAWLPVPHETVGRDGYQVYVDDQGTFGCVFLVHTPAETTFRLARAPRPPVTLAPLPDAPGQPRRMVIGITGEGLTAPLAFRFPETVHSSLGLHFIDHQRDDMPPLLPPAEREGWQPGPTGSWWFDWTLAGGCRFGGIVSPADDGAALEFWFHNAGDTPTFAITQACLMLHAPELADRDGTRTWLRIGGRWVRGADTDRGAGRRELCHYPVVGGNDLSWMEQNPDGFGKGGQTADIGLQAVTSLDGRRVLGLAWQRPMSLLSNWLIPCIHADPIWPECPPKQTVCVRGHLWWITGTLDDLLGRFGERFGG